jgi:hypothetical protein
LFKETFKYIDSQQPVEVKHRPKIIPIFQVW